MFRLINIYLVSFIVLLSCSSTEIKTAKDAKKSYDYGMTLLEKGRYIQARESFEEIKNKMPDTSFATLAELRIADSFYEEESYPEAISSYEVFENLHPGHAERQYVIYRIALSYVKSSPKAIDRDLEPSQKAIASFERLLKLFPNTKYKEKAEKEIIEAREKFIKREYYIGNFYYKRGKYKSCLERYEGIITASGEIKNDITKKAMYELGVAYGKVGDKKNQERIQKLFKQEYPKSKQVLN